LVRSGCGPPPHPDAEVVAAASAAGRLLLTLDRGLGDVRRYPPGSHAGILVLRPDDQSAAAVRETVAQLAADQRLEALTGFVAVVQRGLLRVRRT